MSNPDQQRHNRQFLRYAGMFGQLGALVFALGYCGYQIDEYFEFEIPFIMITLIITGIIAYIIKVIKTFS